jgi:DNA-binding GntR family transcriptional regulator
LKACRLTTGNFFFDAFRKEHFNQLGRLTSRVLSVGQDMVQNSAIVPEDLDRPLTPSTLGIPELRSQTPRIQSLHHDTLSALRDLIVQNQLPPGTRLTEAMLSERFNVSRTPLREALKVLSSEGLVEILPNRGARVVTLTVADIQHLFEVIGALESLAGRLACDHISDAEICDLKAIHCQMQATFFRSDLPEYFRLNQLIHVQIVAAAKNPVLAATHQKLNARLLRARYMANQVDHDRWGAAMREHQRIVEALEQRNGEQTASLLLQHLQHKFEAIRRYLEPARATG